MLKQLKEKLQHYPPDLRQPGTEREAAVLVALTREEMPSVVFVKRAEHVNSHSGEVAFPGGMWEAGDKSLLHTALRESEEEIALPANQVEVVSTLPTALTRFGVYVTPYVGVIPVEQELVPDPAELDAVFRVPLDYLLNSGNLESRIFDLRDGRYRVPCFCFEDYCIWGFTLKIMTSVLNRVFDSGIELQNYKVVKN